MFVDLGTVLFRVVLAALHSDPVAHRGCWDRSSPAAAAAVADTARLDSMTSSLSPNLQLSNHYNCAPGDPMWARSKGTTPSCLQALIVGVAQST